MKIDYISKQTLELKPYQKPELIEYGELRDLTLGSFGEDPDQLGAGSQPA